MISLNYQESIVYFPKEEGKPNIIQFGLIKSINKVKRWFT
jgi:hypothetical protein